jgi:hypothetical protein
MAVRYPLDVFARLDTVTMCVPATAEELADVSCRTFVFELEPVFWASTPEKSVSWLISVESLERSVPRFDSTVSWLSREESCVFHGVSTFCRLATIWETVELTSNPVPLVGDPKLSPTVPIACSAWIAAAGQPSPAVQD